MYSPQLLDHFEHPRNAGELPDADAQVRVENPACGDILELAIKMNAGRIGEIRFRAKGLRARHGVRLGDDGVGEGEVAARGECDQQSRGRGCGWRCAAGIGTRSAVGD